MTDNLEQKENQEENTIDLIEVIKDLYPLSATKLATSIVPSSTPPDSRVGTICNNLISFMKIFFIIN